MVCQPANRAQDVDRAAPATHVVEVTARDYAFEVVAEIPSGWTTFRVTGALEDCRSQNRISYMIKLVMVPIAAPANTSVVKCFAAATRAIPTNAAGTKIHHRLSPVSFL